MKKNLLLSLLIFVLVVITLLFFQQYRKNELITYLTALENRYIKLETIQKISIEANQAGINGNSALEDELNTRLVQLSNEFITSFNDMPLGRGTIKKIHRKLLLLNESTHNLLIYRIEIISQIKDKTLSEEEQKAKIDHFWTIQDENKEIYRQFNDELHKYAKRLGVKITDYAKHLP